MPSPGKKKPGPHARAKARAARAAAVAAGVLPPPAPRSVADTPAPPPSELTAIGAPPPGDSLAQNAWAHEVVIAAMHDAMVDPNISPRERRKELRTLAAAAARLQPDTRRWEAEQLIRRDRAELEQLESDRRGAKLEPRAPRGPLPTSSAPDGSRA